MVSPRELSVEEIIETLRSPDAMERAVFIEVLSIKQIVEKIIKIFRSSDATERAAFIEACSLTKWAEEAEMAAKMISPEMRANALDFAAQGCIDNGSFELGAILGEAGYRLAVEGYASGKGDQGVYRQIAGRSTLNWMNSLQRLGQHQEVVDLIDEPIKWLKSIGDSDTLGMLLLKRVEAELDLENYDIAEELLRNIDKEILSPLDLISYRSQDYRIQQHKVEGTKLPEEVKPPDREDLLKVLFYNIDTKARGKTSSDYFKSLKCTAKQITKRMFGGSNFDVEESPDLKDWESNHRPCYIYAEMDDRVIIGRVTTLEVIVSGDKLEFQTSSTTQGGKVSVTSDKPLIVQVISKTNFTVVDNDQVEVDPPVLGQRHQLYFDLRPTHLGKGEIWAVVRQGQMPLLTLSLKPKIVESQAHIRQAFKARADGNITDFPSPSEPLHQLRIIEQRNGDQIIYRYELDSPALEILKIFVSDPIASKRQEYVENLYREIESRWLSNQDDVEDFTAELRAFGGQLFDELFPNELRSLLWQYRSQIESIMVLSTEPFIPWEIVHLKQPGQTHLPEETNFLGQMGLVRWLYGTFPPQKIQIREGRVLYVIPHYPDPRYRLLQAEQEAQYLEQTFQARAIEPQSKPVRQLLESGNFDLLHFAGHGIAEQGNIGNAKLLMQGRIEGSKYILDYLSATTIEQYSSLKSEVDKNRPMVVLNACQIGREGYALTSIGGFAQAFLDSGAGAFVGPLWSVGDRPARIFTEMFYKGLIEGLTLSEATIRAREQAKQAGDATWLAYAVYGHPNLKVYCEPCEVLPPSKPIKIFGGSNNEFTVRQRINEANYLFTDPHKGRDLKEIEKIIPVLSDGREWMKQHNLPDYENDALWGLYLCYSRTKQESQAIEVLQALRANLEEMRKKISDPMKRASLMSRYPYLFGALCQLLCRSNRPTELLDAMEGAKGRVLADVLTEKQGQITSDSVFSEPAKQLATLMKGVNAHYLSYFVDDEATYAVLVAKDGSIHSTEIPIGKQQIQQWLEFTPDHTPLDPRNWGKSVIRGKKIVNLSEKLTPLVSWLEPLTNQGIIQENDHICYCPDEELHLIPLHYLPFRKKYLVNFVSLSRIQGALALVNILKPEALKPTQFIAVQVWSQKDENPDNKDSDKMLAAFQEVREWLKAHLLGEVLAGANVDLPTVRSQDFKQKIVHFNTHGVFPSLEEQEQREKNPFSNSGLLLAKDGQLPPQPKISKEVGLLSPKEILKEENNQLKLNFEGSHVTLQACVSGRAKEGIGGDALGLEWAFLLNGASSLLASHWHVPADWAAKFSLKFYPKWLFEKVSRGQAWRETVLELISECKSKEFETEHPECKEHPECRAYYWAAFSLSGDWR